MAYRNDGRAYTPEPGLYPNSPGHATPSGYRYSTSADSYGGNGGRFDDNEKLVSSASGTNPRPVSGLMQQLNLDDSTQNGGHGGYQRVQNNNMPGTPGTPNFSVHDDKQGYYADGSGGYSEGRDLWGQPASQQQQYRDGPSGYGMLGSPTMNSKRRNGGGFGGFIRRKPVWLSLIALLILAAAGIGLGIGLPKALSNKSASTGANALGDTNGQTGTNTGASSGSASTGSTSSSGGKGGSTSSSPALDSSGNDPTKITPLPFWNYSDPGAKVIGVSLGGWLVLERWMYEDWFTQAAGNDALDEWTFVKNTGNKAADLLETHWSTWVTEPDLDTLMSVGVNHIRIPLGFWTLIPTTGGEPYINTTQLNHLEQMLGWMWKRGLRALIDMHGMPGSQNGDQSSGHVLSQPGWFADNQQARSDQVIDNLLEWVNNSPYKTVVAGIAPVNEPCGPGKATSDRLSTYQDFLQRTYPKLRKAGFPMWWHHGFASNPSSYWQSYAQTLNPTWAVINDNPYPGYFPAQTDQDTITGRVCQNVQGWASFPIPAVMTEWSLASGIHSGSWNTQYYADQASGYAWSAGSIFWNIRMQNSSNPVQAAPDAVQYQYSMIDLINSGVIPKIQQGQTALQYLQAMPNPVCGAIQLSSW